MKFYEAAKFYYTGGMHEPGGGLSFAFNASLWGSFSEWEKAVITAAAFEEQAAQYEDCLLYTSPSPRDLYRSRMPSSA